MEGAVADEADARMGALLEQLGARFELVLEAVTGFGGRIDALREEMVGQFTEVGRQIRFLSDRIAENRAASAANRADLGAEMIRLGEMIGATRVEFREQISSSSQALVKHLDAELKHTNKTLASLTRKFERFDDRLTVQSKDHDQRLRKLEQRRAAR